MRRTYLAAFHVTCLHRFAVPQLRARFPDPDGTLCKPESLVPLSLPSVLKSLFCPYPTPLRKPKLACQKLTQNFDARNILTSILDESSPAPSEFDDGSGNIGGGWLASTTIVSEVLSCSALSSALHTSLLFYFLPLSRWSHAEIVHHLGLNCDRRNVTLMCVRSCQPGSS